MCEEGSISILDGRRSMFLIGWAFRVGGGRVDVKFGWQAWHCFYWVRISFGKCARRRQLLMAGVACF